MDFTKVFEKYRKDVVPQELLDKLKVIKTACENANISEQDYIDITRIFF